MLQASRQKRHRYGTHRVTDPAETLTRALALAGKFGITRVANITGLDVIGIPVIAVTRPNSKSLAVAQGKGADLVSAKVSGLMESIENYHAENVRKPLLLDCEAELRRRGARVIDVAGLPRVVAGSYDPEGRLLWIAGHEILSREQVLLPFEVVHADFTLPLPACSGAFSLSDSGIASGNDPLEATSHAICELVERDAKTLWQLRSPADRAATRVELSTIDDPACGWALERFEAASVAVGVWDVTSDVGIPSFLCEIADANPNPFRAIGPMSGSGCHPCKEIALFRALSEAAQSRLTVIAGTRDDLGLATYRRGLDIDQTTRSLESFKTPGARSFADIVGFDGETIDDDVSWEVSRLAQRGFKELVTVDLTSPDFGISVVRVVIPGLEGISETPGFVPGERAKALLS